MSGAASRVGARMLVGGSAPEKERRAVAPGRQHRDGNMSRQDGGRVAAKRKATVVEVPESVAMAAAKMAPNSRLVRVVVT